MCLEHVSNDPNNNFAGFTVHTVIWILKKAFRVTLKQILELPLKKSLLKLTGPAPWSPIEVKEGNSSLLST